MDGRRLKLKMSVDYISFSAHADYKQGSEFVRAMKPPHVVSVIYMLFIFSISTKLQSINSILYVLVQV